MLVTGHVLASGGPRRALTHVLLCFEPALCDVQGHNAPRHVACQNEDAEEQHVQHDGQRGVDAVHAACFGTDHGAVRICLDDLTSAGLHIPATTLRLQRTGAIPVRPVPLLSRPRSSEVRDIALRPSVSTRHVDAPARDPSTCRILRGTPRRLPGLRLALENRPRPRADGAM